MAQVITFEDFRPPPRYDSLAWTQVRIEEGAAVDGPWTELETQALSPVDADPEQPAYRDFTTELASDTADLWYRIVFLDASNDESQPTTPIQNTTEDFSAYASVSELFRILKVRTPSDEQRTAGERVLLAAAGRIRSEIDLADDTELSGWKLALAAEVNLEYGADLWRMEEVQIGLVGIGSEAGATFVARDLWEKHAITLEPLKGQWGIA